MAITAKDILKEALELAPAARADLAEKIIESVEADIPPSVQQAHLREIQRRRQEIATGQAQLIPGDDEQRRVVPAESEVTNANLVHRVPPPQTIWRTLLP